jgi:hypothetical protein
MAIRINGTDVITNARALVNVVSYNGYVPMDTEDTTVMRRANNLSDVNNAAAARTNIGIPNITVSTANPSGGANGDLWFQY